MSRKRSSKYTRVPCFSLHQQVRGSVPWRGRYQLQLRSPDFKLGSSDGFYAITFIEFFENVSDGDATLFGDRIRIDAGIGKQLSPALRVELNYLFHQVRVETGPTGFDLDDHVVRLRFFHTLR